MLIRLIMSMLVASSTLITAAPPWTGLPVRTATKSGIAGDPINVAIEGSQMAILSAFQKIGWVQADPLSAKDDVRLAKDALTHTPYPKAPVSRLFLFGRMEDFAVEHELGTVSRRDHARFWDTKRQDTATHLELWIGDASRDIGIKALIRHHIPVGTTHRIDGNLDAERSLIVSALTAAGLVADVVMESGIGPTTSAHNAGGDTFSTDGKVAVIVLKNP